MCWSIVAKYKCFFFFQATITDAVIVIFKSSWFEERSAVSARPCWPRSLRPLENTDGECT